MKAREKSRGSCRFDVWLAERETIMPLVETDFPWKKNPSYFLKGKRTHEQFEKMEDFEQSITQRKATTK